MRNFIKSKKATMVTRVLTGRRRPDRAGGGPGRRSEVDLSSTDPGRAMRPGSAAFPTKGAR